MQHEDNVSELLGKMAQEPQEDEEKLPSLERVKILARTTDFQLELGTMLIVPEFLKGEEGYRLRNLRTGVVEQEGNSYASAIRAMHQNQLFLDEVDADPTGEHQQKQPMTVDQFLGLTQDEAPSFEDEN